MYPQLPRCVKDLVPVPMNYLDFGELKHAFNASRHITGGQADQLLSN